MKPLEKGIADIEKIRKLLTTKSCRQIAKATNIPVVTIEKLKNGERAIEKLNLAYAIRLTEYANQQSAPIIEIWGEDRIKIIHTTYQQTKKTQISNYLCLFAFLATSLPVYKKTDQQNKY